MTVRTDQRSIAVDMLLLTPVVVVACLLAPSVGRWTRGPVTPAAPAGT